MKKLLFLFAFISIVEAVRCFYVFETMKKQMEDHQIQSMLDNFYQIQKKNFDREKKFITSKSMLETVNNGGDYILIFEKEDLGPELAQKIPPEFLPYIGESSYKVLLELEKEGSTFVTLVSMNSEGFVKKLNTHK